MKRLFLFLIAVLLLTLNFVSLADTSNDQALHSVPALSADQTVNESWPGPYLKLDSRKQRDGVSGARSRQWDFMEFRLPEYWGVDGSADCFTAYAETGKKLSVFEVHTDAEDHCVLCLEADEENSSPCAFDINTCLAGLEKRGYSDCTLASMEYTDAGRQEGLLFSVRASFDGFPVNIVAFAYSSGESGHWALFLCSFSDSALYRYDADFKKTISGIQWNREMIGVGIHSSAPDTEAQIQIIQAASVRNQPNYDGERIVLASPDECYRLLGTENGWYELLLESGQIGYFPQKYAVEIRKGTN